MDESVKTSDEIMPVPQPKRDEKFLSPKDAFAVGGNLFNKVGSQLVEDPETGFLYYPNEDPALIKGSFGIERKKKYLEALRRHWPNFSLARKELGLRSSTIREHSAVDVKFAEAIKEIETEMVDQVEGKVMEFAQLPKNFMDRIALLRAYRGELYNPVQKVQHLASRMAPEELATRRVNLAKVVDAEVVQVSESILRTEAEDGRSVESPVFLNGANQAQVL